MIGSAQSALMVGALAVVLIGGAYVKGRRDGAAAERAATLSRSVETLRDRSRTDDEIRSLSDSDLCRRLGGMPTDDGQCL